MAADAGWRHRPSQEHLAGHPLSTPAYNPLGSLMVLLLLTCLAGTAAEQDR